jgi:carbamate kinase
MLVVAALGGNALLRRGEALDVVAQRENVRTAASALAEIAREHRLVVTHGNGPQVGLIALQNEAYRDVRAYPLDVLGAESEGMIGYLLEQALHNELPDRDVATLLTQVVVDHDDPAFAHPTKPIGPVYTSDDARRLAAARGWSVAQDGDGWRRVVPSPRPRRIVELRTIQLLVAANVIVVCAGGGGIPVVERGGAAYGVEAVIDKDFAAAQLAQELRADVLLLLTDVAGVFAGWGTLRSRLIRRAHPGALRELALPPGSMGPKAEAAAAFASATGGVAAIGMLDEARAVLRGGAGTTVSTVCDGLDLV